MQPDSRWLITTTRMPVVAPNVSDQWNPVTGILTVPGVSDNPTIAAAGKKAQSAVPGLGGVAAIGDFFSRLSEPNTWIRVAEVGIGVVILVVALKAMFPGTASAAGSVAGDAAKGALLA